MVLSIRSLKNAVKLLLLFCFVTPGAFAKKPQESHDKILATNYVVQNLDTGEILAEKNTEEVRSIASITKLMTALIVLDAKQDLDEKIEVIKPSTLSSKLPNKITLTRSELLILTLMSSDNLAAKTLAMHFPGGEEWAVRAMNAKAHSIGMGHTKFVEPTGLSVFNVSTVQDLILLLDHAEKSEIIRDYSTRSHEKIKIPGKKLKFLEFRTTNRLVAEKTNIGLSKTGWIRSSGGCLVMIIKEHGQRLAVILLNSRNTHTRIRDGVLLTEYNNVRNQRNFR